MVVEFYGLPGAGKSTIANFINNNFDDCIFFSNQHVKKWAKNKRLLTRLSYILIDWKWIVFNIYFLVYVSVNVSIKNYKNYAKYSFNYFKSVKNYIYLKKIDMEFTHSYVIIDQGLLQDIWSLLIGQKVLKHDIIEKFIFDFYHYLPRRFIYFNIEYELASKRISYRSNGKSRFDGNEHITILANLKSMVSIMEMITKSLKSNYLIDKWLFTVSCISEASIIANNIKLWLSHTD